MTEKIRQNAKNVIPHGITWAAIAGSIFWLGGQMRTIEDHIKADGIHVSKADIMKMDNEKWREYADTKVSTDAMLLSIRNAQEENRKEIEMLRREMINRN